MKDEADTIVDPQIRREAMTPRADHRRTMLVVLLMVATAAITATVTLIYVLRPVSHTPAAAEPMEVVAPVAPVDPVEPVTPVDPVQPLLPSDDPGYGQKGLGREHGRRVDRAPTN